MGFRFRRCAVTASNSSVRGLFATGSTSLADGSVANAYSHLFTADGGVLPYVAFTAINALPAGLSLSTNGLLSGTPSTTSISTFSVQVQDAAGSTARDSYRLQIISSGASGPLTLSIQNSTGAPQGVVGNAYSLSINSTGGVTPYSSFALIGGSLPAGITLHATAGTLTGTPSTTAVSTFTVQVKDAVGSTARQSFRLAVISSAASGSSQNAYFSSMLSHPNIYRSWDMRSSTSLTALLSPNSSVTWTYVWPNDGYHDPQDAVKFYKPPNSSAQSSDSLGQQVHFPIGASTAGGFTSMFVSWDFFFGVEFGTNMGGVTNHKEFTLCDGTSSGATSKYAELRNHWVPFQSTYVAETQYRMYYGSTVAAAVDFVSGMKDRDPYWPTGPGAALTGTDHVRQGMWTRYWLEVKLSEAGNNFTDWNAPSFSSGTLASTTNYRMLSVWKADEVTDPVRVLYRVPVRTRFPFITLLRYEFNTSSAPSSNGNPDGQTGPLFGYTRGLYMLKDATIDDSDTSIFKRPLG
jgi:hypothetical protein